MKENLKDIKNVKRKDFLNRFAKSLLLLNASEPPLKMTQFPDLKHNVEISEVTFGLLSYITPEKIILIINGKCLKEVLDKMKVLWML